MKPTLGEVLKVIGQTNDIIESKQLEIFELNEEIDKMFRSISGGIIERISDQGIKAFNEINKRIKIEKIKKHGTAGYTYKIVGEKTDLQKDYIRSRLNRQQLIYIECKAIGNIHLEVLNFVESEGISVGLR